MGSGARGGGVVTATYQVLRVNGGGCFAKFEAESDVQAMDIARERVEAAYGNCEYAQDHDVFQTVGDRQIVRAVGFVSQAGVR